MHHHHTRRPTLLATALALAVCAPTFAFAQEGDGVSQLDTIAVTGSRIKRAEMEGPAPVTVGSTRWGLQNKSIKQLKNK